MSQLPVYLNSEDDYELTSENEVAEGDPISTIPETEIAEKAALVTPGMFDSWLLGREIEGLLTDLDDTYLKTYDEYIKAFYDIGIEVMTESPFDQLVVARNLDIVVEALKTSNIKFLDEFGVGRERWDVVMDDFLAAIMGQNYSLFRAQIKEYGVGRMQQIYSATPEVAPGGIELLRLVTQVDLPLAIVTHADEEQTRIKIEQTPLCDYVDISSVWLANVDAKKSDMDWRFGLQILNQNRGLNLSSSQVMGLGDSVSSDAIAAIEAGVDPRKFFLLPSPFSPYAQGNVPEGVTRINSITHFLAQIYDESIQGY